MGNKIRWCEFRAINKLNGCKISGDETIITVVKTVEGGEVVHCDNQKCIDLVQARETEVDTWISPQKEKEAARLITEYGDLKTEIDKTEYSNLSDPETLAILNDPDKGVSEDNPIISADDFKEAMDPAEFQALTDSKNSSLAVFTAGGTINLAGENTKATMDSIFPPESKSRKAIEGLRLIKKSIGQNLGRAVTKQEHIERAKGII